MTTPEPAAIRYRNVIRVKNAAVAEASRQWRRLRQQRLDESWFEQVGPQVLAAVALAQLAAAEDSDSYIAAMLRWILDSSDVPQPAGRVVPEEFSGIASDGRELDSLLYEPVITTKAAIKQGASVRQALFTGETQLGMIVSTQVTDAARTADQVALTAQPALGGYVRMLNPPSCARCAVLAGRFYRWNAGFERHPQCLPAGVAVSGPKVEAATRRWYEGELAVIRTANGQELPVTGNHPVLTNRGWLPANLLEEGDYVVSSVLCEGASPLVIPNERQVPALAEDLAGSLGVVRLYGVPTTAEDFHGDGGHGEVDVVFADCFLQNRPQAAAREPFRESAFSVRVGGTAELASDGASKKSLVTLNTATHNLVSRTGLGPTLSGGHLCSPSQAGIGTPPWFDASAFESSSDHVTRDLVAAGEAVLTLPTQVSLGNFMIRQMDLTLRWDAPADSFSMESRGTYASIGEDLRLRLAGQVELDRVVELRRVRWSGHVYNLTSVEGWYSANGIIVSNCDCLHIPVTEDVADDARTDPRAAVLAGQVRGLSQADRQAIVDGADVGQVVNAHRGMYTAGGRKFTREGTTRRGFARKRLGKGVPRLRPEEIYKLAEDRDDAIRLLYLHGYIV